jgi:hypothetical protein
MTRACSICGCATRQFARATVLRRHKVSYFRCETCGYICTEDPYWLEEAYSEALSSLDVGAVSRNLRAVPVTGAVIRLFFDQNGRFIDYGAGAGLLVRLMRDAGFNFLWADKFARNTFARGFEAGPGSYEMVTAFEVFEHLADPVCELEKMLSFSRNILFSTVLVPARAPDPGQWWYYGLDHGQHVSFYTPQALRALGSRFGLSVCSSGELHLLSSRPVAPWKFRLLTRPRVCRWINRFQPRPSLTGPDYQLLAKALSDPHESIRI